jgi:putative membrane protein
LFYGDLMISSLTASLHYFALAIGLGGVFMRGRYLKALIDNPTSEIETKRLLIADNFWGVAALLWILTGLARAFGGLEKGTDFYLHNPLFHLKMTLFVLIFLLEIAPAIAFMKLRTKRVKFAGEMLSPAKLALFRKINHWEAILAFMMIFVASAMARGLWSV